MSGNAITAVQTRSSFRLRCAVSARIQAPPETVWELLTRADGMVGATDFQMTETFAGILLPALARRLPDFGPIFERYATDLRVTAEQ